MNNATHENSLHAVPVPDDAHPEGSPAESFHTAQQTEDFTEVTAQLDQIRFAPRAATIRAIMHYAHKQDEAVH